jgi:hypothetical protein
MLHSHCNFLQIVVIALIFFVHKKGYFLVIDVHQQTNITHITTTLVQSRYQLAAPSSGELVFFEVDSMQEDIVTESIYEM